MKWCLQEAGLLDREGVEEVAKGRRLTQQEALLVHDQEHWLVHLTYFLILFVHR
jgi:hypothetical protein